MNFFRDWKCYPQIFRYVIITMLGLAWTSFAFISKFEDAIATGDLAKVRALLKNDPDLAITTNDFG